MLRAVVLLSLFAAAALASGTTRAPPSPFLDTTNLRGNCFQLATVNKDGVSILTPASRDMGKSYKIQLTASKCGSQDCFKAKKCKANKPQLCSQIATCSSSRNQPCTQLVRVDCSGLPLDFDGNNDGIPDSQQKNVATVKGNFGTVTVVAKSKKTIVDINVQGVPQQVSRRAIDAVFPFGAFQILASNLAPGAKETFDVLVNPIDASLCDGPYGFFLKNKQGNFVETSSKKFSFPKAAKGNYCKAQLKLKDQKSPDTNLEFGAIDAVFAIGTIDESSGSL
eukprot:m.41530 g.41530  ORF g.41530 m.41530 type:complete len:280 (-) comp14238_c0_seq2:128-967(-)